MGLMDLNKILHGIFGSKSVVDDIPPPPNPTHHHAKTDQTTLASLPKPNVQQPKDLSDYSKEPTFKPAEAPNKSDTSMSPPPPDILATPSGKRTLAVVESLLSNNLQPSAPVSFDEEPKESESVDPFHLADGAVLHTLHDLRTVAKHMPSEVFSHHVTQTRNDFANWLRHSHKNESLAKDVEDVESPEQLHDVIEKHLNPDVQEKYLQDLKEELHEEVEHAIDEMRSQTNRIDELRERIEASQKAVAQQEKELQDQLASIRAKQEEMQRQIADVQHIDAQTQETVQEHSSRTPLDELYHIIAHIQGLIQDNNWGEARHFYNQARQVFQSMDDLSEDVHHELHQSLMELYTTIHLHDIE